MIEDEKSSDTKIDTSESVEHFPELGLGTDSFTELEFLRTILSGHHNQKGKQKEFQVELSQNVHDMLGKLELQLRTTSEAQASTIQAIQTQFATEVSENIARSSNMLRATKQELTKQLDNITDTVNSNKYDLKNELTLYIDQRLDEQTTQLRHIQKTFTDQLELLSEDLFTQINQTHRVLTNQLATQTLELDARIKLLRDDNEQSLRILQSSIDTHLDSVDQELTSQRDRGRLYLLELSKHLYE